MRWIIRIFILLFLVWGVYAASPYAALYSLAKAVEAKDVAALNERVNFQAVRLSLSKQIVSAYLRLTGKGKETSSSPFGQVAASAGASIIDPVIEPLVSAEAMIDLLENGWPAELGGAARMRKRDGPQGLGFDPARFVSLQGAARLFMASETRGFRAVLFTIPFDGPPEERIKLQFRLSGLSWRLVGIELPEAVKARLVQELAKRNASST
jgi:hypothetical protein